MSHQASVSQRVAGLFTEEKLTMLIDGIAAGGGGIVTGSPMLAEYLAQVPDQVAALNRETLTIHGLRNSIPTILASSGVTNLKAQVASGKTVTISMLDDAISDMKKVNPFLGFAFGNVVKHGIRQAVEAESARATPPR